MPVIRKKGFFADEKNPEVSSNSQNKCVWSASENKCLQTSSVSRTTPRSLLMCAMAEKDCILLQKKL